MGSHSQSIQGWAHTVSLFYPVKDPGWAEITIGTLRNNENSMFGVGGATLLLKDTYLILAIVKASLSHIKSVVWDTSRYQAKGDIAKQTLCQPNQDFPD